MKRFLLLSFFAFAALSGPVVWGQGNEPITQVVPVQQEGSPTPPPSPTPAPIHETAISTVISPTATRQTAISTVVSPTPSPTPSPAPAVTQMALPPIGSGPEPEQSGTAAMDGTVPADNVPEPAASATPVAAAPGPAKSAAPPEPAPQQEAAVPSPTPDLTYSIEIDLTHQRAYLLDEGHIMAESPISSGREGHLTETGNFEVLQKDLNHFSNLYGEFVDIASGRVVKAGADAAMPVPKGCKFVPAPMKWFMRFDGAAGMHAGILPGYAASHGCVRMPASNAKFFYETVVVGTPVHVFGTAPVREIEEKPRPRAAVTPIPTPAAKAHHGWWF